jgi:hypothetical protein
MAVARCQRNRIGFVAETSHLKLVAKYLLLHRVTVAAQTLSTQLNKLSRLI